MQTLRRAIYPDHAHAARTPSHAPAVCNLAVSLAMYPCTIILTLTGYPKSDTRLQPSRCCPIRLRVKGRRRHRLAR